MWRKIPVYIALYKSKGGIRIVVKTLHPPPDTRTFRTGQGLKKFKLKAVKKTTKEFIIMAKAARTKKKTDEDEILDAELEELEEELEELEDEDEDEDVELEEETDDEDEDDDEEEEPAPKKKRSKGAAPGKSRAAATGKVGTAEVAAHCGVDPRTLRMVLRKHKIAKDEESGRYEWASLKSKEVVKIKKLIDAGEAQEVKREGLEKLKAQKEKERAAAKKSGKKGKKKPEPVEDDDDEDDE